MLRAVALAMTLIYLPISLAFAASAHSELWQQANAAYEMGDYKDAIRAYESIRAEGLKNGHLYYNLGNAYFKMGESGSAILNYERARKLLPRNRDVRMNLRVAQEQLQDETGGAKHSFLGALAGKYLGLLSVAEARRLEFGLFLVLCLLGVLWHSRLLSQIWVERLGLPRVVATCAVLWLIALAGLGGKYLWELQNQGAVVRAQEMEVRSGPGPDYPLQFQLHEGYVVQLEGEMRSGWSRVRAREGLEGWARSGDLEVI
ncbi:MAG: tetratricopeptide repeat protein [Candidatus Omnitrophica bacterium]|nr:tetratricopeptide repeat protein [Candidatus Omnitrophota bacterium]